MKPLKSFEETLAEEMKDPQFEEEFLQSKAELLELSSAIEERIKAGLTQEAVAKKMGTSQSAVARLELGLVNGHLPSLNSLKRYASAIGKRLEVKFI